MGHIEIRGISGKIKSKLGSVKDVPMRSIEKYSNSNMTIVNEDNIQEYIEASSRGQGDEYMENTLKKMVALTSRPLKPLRI